MMFFHFAILSYIIAKGYVREELVLENQVSDIDAY